MINIQLDSIIYALQTFGGASVYWQNIVDRVRADGRFCVSEIHANRYSRGIPVRSQADVFHSSHFRTTIRSKAKTVTTVHDLTYELGMLGWGLKAKLNIAERRRSYFSADAIICISQNTKNDLLDIYPSLSGRCPIHVVHHGFSVPQSHDELMPSPSYDRYMLYVGGRSNYKNFYLALQGFVESGLWRDGFKLICTGSQFSEQELQMFRDIGVEHALINAGLLDQATLFSLYRSAHCLLYTSRYEGFGLPLIEAMSVGCPVIGVNSSCIPEIVGSAGLLVDPDSPDEVARAILDLEDHDKREFLVAAGFNRAAQFSWDTSADQHMNLYAAMVSV